MSIIIQKFGGTSVSKEQSRIHCLKHVQTELRNGHKVVVVISAMGRKGDPYATDTLLSLIGPSANHLSKKDLDLFLSTGELISASVFSNLLHENGITNTILTGGQAGIITNQNHTDAQIVSLEPSQLEEALSLHDVVVVPGFQGMTTDGFTTTLGRGGSDTTATAIGASIRAEYVDIFTDVEGIMTADPRIVQNAKIIETADYNEICNLAHLGAKVIHPRAVEIAMQQNIPIRVRSTFSQGEGTLITTLTEINRKTIQDSPVIGITQTDNLMQITIAKERFENIFQLFNQHDISLDFIQVTPTHVSFTLPMTLKDAFSRVQEEMSNDIILREDVAKVSIVGAGMQGVSGVMASSINSLYSNQIDVLQTADSHTTIWFLVPSEHMKQAVIALHDTFIS